MTWCSSTVKGSHRFFFLLFVIVSEELASFPAMVKHQNLLLFAWYMHICERQNGHKWLSGKPFVIHSSSGRTPKKSVQSVRQTVRTVCISVRNTLASVRSIATSVRTVFSSVRQLKVSVRRTAASVWTDWRPFCSSVRKEKIALVVFSVAGETSRSTWLNRETND